jgi:hypothetical protein
MDTILAQGHFGFVHSQGLDWVSKTAKPSGIEELKKEFLSYHYHSLIDLQGSVIPYLRGDSSPEQLNLQRVEGSTLAELAASANVDFIRWSAILQNVVKSVSQFHREAGMHGDLHAKNILVQEDNKVWIIDLAFFIPLDEVAPCNIVHMRKADWNKLYITLEGLSSPEKWKMTEALIGTMKT